MKAAIIYHRIDFDGICSFAIVNKFLRDLHGDSVEVIPFPYTHGDESPFKTIEGQGFDEVYILDICLPAEDMRGLLFDDEQGILHVIWIDHHLTSEELSIENNFGTMPGLRACAETQWLTFRWKDHQNLQRAWGRPRFLGACALTWLYMSKKATGNALPLPRAVELLAQYDTFEKGPDWHHDVLPFQYGMRNDYGLDTDHFLDDFEWLLDGTNVEGIRNRGHIILAYALQTATRAVETYGFETTIGGRKAIACLTNTFGSLGFEKRMAESDAAICLCINRTPGKDSKNFKVSAYADADRNDLNLGEYMSRHYDGGGHPNAAGGTLSAQQFLSLLQGGKL